MTSIRLRIATAVRDRDARRGRPVESRRGVGEPQIISAGTDAAEQDGVTWTLATSTTSCAVRRATPVCLAVPLR